MESEPGRGSTSCNIGTGGGSGGTCTSSRAPRGALLSAVSGAAAPRSLWMSRRPPTGWPPSRTGSCESPATMAITRVTPARKVRRRGSALLEAPDRGGMGEAAPSGHLQPCLRRKRHPAGGGATGRKVCTLSSVLNHGREMEPGSLALRSLETVAALAAEAQRGPGERSRRPSARSPLGYLRPEEANMAVYLAESQPLELHSRKPLLGARLQAGRLETQAGQIGGGASESCGPSLGSRGPLGRLAGSGLLRRCKRGNHSC